MSYFERKPRPTAQVCPHMSPVAFSPVVLFEYDENLVFEHEMLGFRLRQAPKFKNITADLPAAEVE